MALSRQPLVQYRISSFQEVLLKASALTLDGVGFLLMLTVIGEAATEIIGLTGDALFLLWFWMLGVKFLGGRANSKIMTFLVNAVIEVVPFVNGIYPGFSIAVWRMVRITKDEDEEKAKNVASTKLAKDAQQARLRAQAEAVQAKQQAQIANDAAVVADPA